MKETIAFLLPPALAFSGMRVARLLLGREIESRFGIGLRWALGMGIGMLLFTQAALLGALAGVNLAGPLAWLALIWGLAEIIIAAPNTMTRLVHLKMQPAHLWLVILLPLLYFCWVFSRLSTLEGTLEFDANAFWVFKAKVLYLEQGGNLLHWMHQTSLAYAHWDYPMLVPCLYLLDYGAVGSVDEFVNKVWPFWMIIALGIGTLSMAKTWQRPHPLPMLAVVVLCLLPATLHFVRQEGGTIPLLFFASLTAMLLVRAITSNDAYPMAAAMLTAVGGAMSKFEGMIYLAIWFCVLLPLCWRRGWFKNRILWRSAMTCIICVLPYALFRLAKPVEHPESGWWRDGLATPGMTLYRFPQAWFMNIGGRFFNGNFFHWQSNQGHLQWIGHWNGLGSLANEQLSILPWLLLIVIVMSLWQKRSRLATASLSIVIVGVFTVLALALSCLPFIQGDLDQMITYSKGDEVGRYSYPFIIAWFLGIMVAWFDNLDAIPEGTKETNNAEEKIIPQ
ncbi:MAG TPA: hypothetical protein VGI03_00165 [Verrucomicrobiae bacterium]|jgi:hypothetical protein